MAKNYSKKSCYPSKYSPNGWVTSAQYILELICEKKAEFEKTKLPIQFWNLPKWKSYFKMQLRKCHTLLHQYDELAIIRALNNRNAQKIYSLYAPWLEKIIKQEQIKLLQEKKRVLRPIENYKTIDSQPRLHKPQNNLLYKLND